MKDYRVAGVLSSDLFRQRIIQNAFDTKIDNPDDLFRVYRNLAAQAVQKRNFLSAERYYGMEQKIEQSDHENYYFLIMYLLHISGKTERAIKIRDQYINGARSNQEERR